MIPSIAVVFIYYTSPLDYENLIVPTNGNQWICHVNVQSVHFITDLTSQNLDAASACLTFAGIHSKHPSAFHFPSSNGSLVPSPFYYI